MPKNAIGQTLLPNPVASLVLGCALAVMATGTLVAEAPVVAPAFRWDVKSDFTGEEASEELSGAACARTAPSFQSCLVVNDKKRYMQFFSIDRTTIIPGRTICMTDGPGDPDAEAVAFDTEDNYFYVTGSHGRKRNHPDNTNDSSYAIFRFKANAAAGNSKSTKCDKHVVDVEHTGKLREIIANAREIGEFYDKPLAANPGGVNVEGIAARRHRLYFGLRGPSIDGKAFIISVAIDGLFGNDHPQSHVHDLELGQTTGIRDLAAVANGLLVLSGPVNDQEEVKPSVFFWDGSTATPTKLAVLGNLPKKAKAETLLVLEEQTDHYRVLIMFDGPDNGRPTEYRIPRH